MAVRMANREQYWRDLRFRTNRTGDKMCGGLVGYWETEDVVKRELSRVAAWTQV